LTRSIHSVAIINPLGDYGINAYSFELAEGLAANGLQVDLYTSGASPLNELPSAHKHRCFPVLGSALFKQRSLLKVGGPASGAASAAGGSADGPQVANEDLGPLRTIVRHKFLGLELPYHLKKRRYDLIWTQWPDVYGSGFWSTCRQLSMPTAHTVHNILPREEGPKDLAAMRRVYSESDVLFVHSEQTRREFLQLYPDCHKNLFVIRHGIYTVYQGRPAARERLRRELAIEDHRPVAILCGLIRPDKNIDSLLSALADPRCSDAALVVAGCESGYPDASPADPLGRTRRLARELGIADRVRLMPGFLHSVELAELFEAGDVLVLPYRKSYGSGLLLLGMTFGKHIVATDVGGAGEYLSMYPRHNLLGGTDAAQVAAGLGRALETINSAREIALPLRLEALEWPTIARCAIAMIDEVL